MAIALPCPKCKAKLKGPDQLVGRTLKCPGCGTPVLITANAIVPAPPSEQKAPPPPPAAKPKPAAPPSLFDATDDVGFKDDPQPAAPPPKPQPTRSAAPKQQKAEPEDDEPFTDFEVMDEDEPKPSPKKKPAPPMAKKPAPPKKTVPAPPQPSNGAFPNMELDDEPTAEVAAHDEVPEAAVDEEEVPEAAVEEDEGVVAAIEEEEEIWVDPVEDEGGEDELAVVAEEDEVLDAVAADEDDLDEVEAASVNVTFRLLSLSRLHVRSQSGMFAITNAYDLLNPKNKKKVGEAVERADAAQTVLTMFVGKNVASTRIEVIEGRNNLLMTIRRAPYLINARADIFDADDKKLGSFEIRPFSALTGNPLWITDPRDKKLIKLEMKLFSGAAISATRRAIC